ncbi:MAG: hypothetical protein LKE40_15235 [Spirochaetia bacterium]|jgi:hypothetical protein|nr:hypothetical protein [Spirochaetia bacterium]
MSFVSVIANIAVLAAITTMVLLAIKGIRTKKKNKECNCTFCHGEQDCEHCDRRP